MTKGARGEPCNNTENRANRRWPGVGVDNRCLCEQQRLSGPDLAVVFFLHHDHDYHVAGASTSNIRTA